LRNPTFEKNNLFSFLSEYLQGGNMDIDMDIVRSPISTLNHIYEISGVEVGQHFYWQKGGFQVHVLVLITSWVLIVVLSGSTTIVVKYPQTIPTGGQNFVEYILNFF
jgi:F-type H+-transporting ATPase subunit a